MGRLNLNLNDLLKDMPLTEPKSCRVFFSGQEHAGEFNYIEPFYFMNSNAENKK